MTFDSSPGVQLALTGYESFRMKLEEIGVERFN